MRLIPKEYLPSAVIALDNDCGYENSSCATMSISYKRPETDDEWARREEGELDRYVQEGQRLEVQLRQYRARPKPVDRR